MAHYAPQAGANISHDVSSASPSVSFSRPAKGARRRYTPHCSERVPGSPLPWHRDSNPWVHASRTALRTMAPDKSHLVTNLNQLLRLTDSSLDSVAGYAPSEARHKKHAILYPEATTEPPYGMQSGLNAQSAVPQPLAPLQQATDGDDYHPSDGWRPRSHHLDKAQLWQRIREEAALDAVLEPALATHLHSVILSHRSMEGAMAFLLANKLADGMTFGSVQLMSLIRDVYKQDPNVLEAGIADMHAVLDRDPACSKFSQCMLQFKGYLAIQSYRVTHHLWNQGRQALALAMQSRISELFAVDLHPAAILGWGVMLDHATGVVIGETCVVGDNVSMLHHVSLGGSGTGRGSRHPQIGHGVLLGAGVAVLGPVTVGAGSKVGAGSVVVDDLPAHCVAVGVPARIVRRNLREEPIRDMDQCADFILDYVI